jgi:hypothetical protein
MSPGTAAIAYCLDNVLVFDLSRRTFDVSLLTIESAIFEVIHHFLRVYAGQQEELSTTVGDARLARAVCGIPMRWWERGRIVRIIPMLGSLRWEVDVYENWMVTYLRREAHVEDKSKPEYRPVHHKEGIVEGRMCVCRVARHRSHLRQPNLLQGCGEIDSAVCVILLSG